MSVVQYEQEICVNSLDEKDFQQCVSYGLQVVALLCGFLVLCIGEPLTLVSYVLRAVRLRKIFDAQQVYFYEERKPIDLIEKFKEKRLVFLTCLITGTTTLVFLTVAICLNYFPSERSLLFLLPSMNTSSFSHELTS